MKDEIISGTFLERLFSRSGSYQPGSERISAKDPRQVTMRSEDIYTHLPITGTMKKKLKRYLRAAVLESDGSEKKRMQERKPKFFTSMRPSRSISTYSPYNYLNINTNLFYLYKLYVHIKSPISLEC